MKAIAGEERDPVFAELDTLIAAGKGDVPRVRYPGWERDYPYGAAQERMQSEGALSPVSTLPDLPEEGA